MARSGLHLLQDRRGRAAGAIVDEDERTIAFMDIAPATRGHALVIPRAHASDLLSVERRGPAAAAIAAAQRLAARMQERLGADGVNLLNSCGAAAWQTVFHFHIHVIPRYEDDPLRLPWVPAAGDPGEIAAAAQELAGRPSEILRPLHRASERVLNAQYETHIHGRPREPRARARAARRRARHAHRSRRDRRATTPATVPSCPGQPLPGRQPHDRLPGQGRQRSTTR